jgi:sulfite exporter TauE/SafE
MNALLLPALLLGATSSAHCVVMCGPIALAVPVPGRGMIARVGSTLLLNSGRLVTYALLGAMVGTFGMGLRLAGLQQAVSIAAGCMLLLAVLMPRLLDHIGSAGLIALGISRIRSFMARHLRRTAPEAIFLSGMLNGMLPCGLVYAALIGSLALGSTLSGMLFMVLFGLGTWPALFAVKLSGGMLGTRARRSLLRLAPVAMTVMGALLILRGLDLGIPFISPGAPSLPFAASDCEQP